MAIVDIIIIAILLIGAIVGFCRGMVRSLFGFFATVGALVAAYFLAQPLLNLVEGWFPGFRPATEGWFSPLLGKISFGDISCATTYSSADSYVAALTSAKESGIFGSIFSKLIDQLIAAAPELNFASGGVSIASQLAVPVAYFVRMAMAFVVLFILLRVALFILEKLLERLFHLAPLKTVDRLLGLVIGAAEAFVFVGIVLTIAVLVFPNNEHVVMQYILDSKIAVWINGWNPLPNLLTNLFNNWFGA